MHMMTMSSLTWTPRVSLISHEGNILVKVRGSAPSSIRYAMGGRLGFLSEHKTPKRTLQERNSRLPNSIWIQTHLCSTVRQSPWRTSSLCPSGGAVRLKLHNFAINTPPDSYPAGTVLPRECYNTTAVWGKPLMHITLHSVWPIFFLFVWENQSYVSCIIGRFTVVNPRLKWSTLFLFHLSHCL